LVTLLKLKRIDAGLSLRALHAQTNIQPTTLSLIERALLVASPCQLDKIATVLGVTPAEALLRPVALHELQRVEQRSQGENA
jgi:transcriptional regulator with XRE-family HTH domain